MNAPDHFDVVCCEAQDILVAAADAISSRANQRDLEAGERTMGRAIAVFNAWRTHNGAITEAEGWVFMAILKLCRANAGAHNIDDYVDAAAYVALAGEHADKLDESAY
jgi:hypothetical protein